MSQLSDHCTVKCCKIITIVTGRTRQFLRVVTAIIVCYMLTKYVNLFLILLFISQQDILTYKGDNLMQYVNLFLRILLLIDSNYTLTYKGGNKIQWVIFIFY